MLGRIFLAFAVACAGLMAADMALARWTSATQMEEGRAQLGAVAIGDLIYVAGGTSLTGPVTSFDSFDPIGEDWRPLPPMPEGLQHFGMAAIGKSVIVAGGYSTAHPDSPGSHAWIFDVQSAQWRRIADLPAPRAGLALVAVNDTVYAVGGLGASARQSYRYDVAGNKWIAAFSPLPEERSGHAAVAVGNKIFVIGGQPPGGKAASDVFVLDTVHGSWSEGPKLPVALSGHTAAVLDGVIHVAGGAAPPAMKTSAAHYVLDPGKGGWTEAANMITPRQGMASAVVRGKWYVFGGSAGFGFFSAFTPSDAVEIYTSN